MTDERQDNHTEREDALSAADEALEELLEKPVFKGEKGIDTAQVWMSAFLIVIAGLIVYSGVFSVPFHAADRAIIVENEAVHSLGGVGGALDEAHMGPVTTLTFGLNWLVTPNSPVAFHAVNLFLHLLNSVLLFLLARRILGEGTPEPVAMVGGMAFAVLPWSTVCVAYVAARPMLLLTGLSLGCVLFYLRATKNDETRYGPLAVSFVCMALAWCVNAAAALLPLFVLIADRSINTRQPRRGRGLILLAYWFVLAAFLVQRVADRGALDMPWISATLARFGTSAGAALLGISLLLIFTSLALGRYWPVGLPLVWIFAAMVALSAWKPGDVLLAQSRLYFRMAGVALVLPCFFLLVRKPGPRVALGVAMTALIIAGGVAAFQQTALWRDEIALWEDALERADKPAQPARTLAGIKLRLANQTSAEAAALAATDGREAVNQRAEAAQELYSDTVTLLEAHGCADAADYAHLADARSALGMMDGAIEAAREAVRHDLNNPEYAARLAFLLEARARATGSQEDRVHALDYFDRAVSLEGMDTPRLVGVLVNYGSLLYAIGDFDGCIRQYERARALDKDVPLQPPLRELRAMRAQLAGMAAQADKLLSQDPNDLQGLRMRGQVYVLSGRAQDAVYVLDQLLRLAPDDEAGWVLMGQARAKMSDVEGFLAEYPDAPPVPPGEPSAWRQVARMCAISNLWDAALTYLEAQAERTSVPQPPLVTLADIARELRQLPRAESYYRAAAEAYPGNPAPWLGLADVAILSNRQDMAAKFLAEAESRGAEAGALSSRREAAGIEAPAPQEETEATGRPMLR